MGLLTDEDFWNRLGEDPDEMYEKLGRQLLRRSEIDAPLPGRAAIKPIDDMLMSFPDDDELEEAA